MSNVTCWYRNVETDKAKPPRFSFNHIENGHTDLDAPTPNCDYQRKAWAGVGWKRTRARIENGVVIHEITDGSRP